MTTKIVLVADDEDDVRDLVEMVLVEAGLGVVPVADGAAALNALGDEYDRRVRASLGDAGSAAIQAAAA